MPTAIDIHLPAPTGFYAAYFWQPDYPACIVIGSTIANALASAAMAIHQQGHFLSRAYHVNVFWVQVADTAEFNKASKYKDIGYGPGSKTKHRLEVQALIQASQSNVAASLSGDYSMALKSVDTIANATCGKFKAPTNPPAVANELANSDRIAANNARAARAYIKKDEPLTQPTLLN